MANPRQHQIIPATITAAGNSGPLKNLGRSDNPTVEGFLKIAGPVTNGGGTLTFSLDVSGDGGATWASVGTFTAQSAVTAANTAIRAIFQNVLAPDIRVSWAITGTSPSYAGVEVDLFFSSPDN